MMENRLSKRELLDWINVVSFAVDDVKLFLDTHPYDEEALLYFDEFKKQRVQAMKEYAKNYGPLTLDTAAEYCGRWKWALEPVSYTHLDVYKRQIEERWRSWAQRKRAPCLSGISSLQMCGAPSVRESRISS